MPPSLLSFLQSSLINSTPPASPQRDYHLSVLRSQPQRSHALFPHASNAKQAKVYHEEVLVVLSEQRVVPAPSTPAEPSSDAPKKSAESVNAAGDSEANASANDGVDASTSSSPSLPSSAPAPLPTDSSSASTAPTTPQESCIPLVALEATLYSLPSSLCTLVYISKVDTTGLSPSSRAPTRDLVSAFLAYHLEVARLPGWRVRIHLFARSQPAYLFPGSAENEGKKVLDDKGLLRWWKGTAERAIASLSTAEKEKESCKSFYLVPGLSYLESLPYVPSASSSSTAAAAAVPWVYGHPYSTLSSPLHPYLTTSPAPSSFPLADHLPSFPDDPKSRFLHSLSSSLVSPSGTPGDWDDVHLSLATNTLTTGQAPGAKRAAVEADLERERKRLNEGVEGGVEEWWERMAYRQECCSGVLVGFFVLAAGETPSTPPPPPSPTSAFASPSKRSSANTSSSHRPQPKPLALRPALFTKLWSAFHNQDYALPALPLLASTITKWREDVTRVSLSEYSSDIDGGEEGKKAAWETEYEEECMKAFEVKGRELTSAEKEAKSVEDEKVAERKRKGEGEGGVAAGAEQPKVNVLAPRKKKKKVEV